MAKKKSISSVEERVEDFYKEQLHTFGIKYYGKTESINDAIDTALKNAPSKSGGNGSNYPDIRTLITTRNQRVIPVIIEAKGKDGKLYTAFHIHTNYDAPSGDRRACITEVYFDEKGEFKIKP